MKKIFLCYDARISFYFAWVLIMAKSFLLPNAESIRKGFFQNNCCIVLFAFKKVTMHHFASREETKRSDFSFRSHKHSLYGGKWGLFLQDWITGALLWYEEMCVLTGHGIKSKFTKERSWKSFFSLITFCSLFFLNIVMICLSFEWRCNKIDIALLQGKFKTLFCQYAKTLLNIFLR